MEKRLIAPQFSWRWVPWTRHPLIPSNILDYIWNQRIRNIHLLFVILQNWCVCCFLVTIHYTLNIVGNWQAWVMAWVWISITPKPPNKVKSILGIKKLIWSCPLSTHDVIAWWWRWTWHRHKHVQSRPSWQREAWFQLISRISSGHDQSWQQPIIWLNIFMETR